MAEDLTAEKVERGMRVLRYWCQNHPNKNEFVVLPDDWTPATILEVLEERVQSGDLGHRDLPEMILESASEAKEVPD